MLTIYLHYEDTNQEAKILQRSMMRRDVSYYDLILMIEEVGFQAIDFLYYATKNRLGSSYLVHICDEGLVMKMLSDPEIVEAVHLYVSKEKTDDHMAPPSKQIDIAPSNHPTESVLLQDVVSLLKGQGNLLCKGRKVSLLNHAYYIFVSTFVIIGIKDVWLFCRTIT